MTLPNARDILALDTETVPGFILAHAKDHKLSSLMKRLNSEMLGDDADARQLAAQAIQRLGFPLLD